MKTTALCLAASLALLSSPALHAAQTRFKGHTFQAWVKKADGPRYREHRSWGRSKLKVRAGEEYHLVIHNPLPVRAAVAVTVDGLNTVDGARSTPSKARKWIVEPHGRLVIRGWQTGKHKSRKFVFTDPGEAYATWREKREGRRYSRNLGVIGFAWFWNKEDLHRALHPPKPFEDERVLEMKRSKPGGGADGAPSAARADRQAGTGMGDEQTSHVRRVEFNANAGMFSTRDVLKLYYEFADDPEEPQPFVDEEERDFRFAPEMP